MDVSAMFPFVSEMTPDVRCGDETSTQISEHSLQLEITTQNLSTKTDFGVTTRNLSTKTDDVTGRSPFNPWNNANNVISLATFKVVENILDCRINPAIFLLGAPLNILSLVVFFRQGIKDRMNFSLFSLSLTDLLYIITFFAFTPYCYVSEETDPVLRDSLQWRMRNRIVNFTFGFLYSSGCLTAIISVERCLCVVNPMKAATLVKTRTMVFLIVGTVVMVQVLCSVFTLKYEVVPIKDAMTGRTRYAGVNTELYAQHKLLFDTVEFIVLPGMTLLNFFVVAIATAVTVVKLTQAIKWRQNTSSTAGDKRQMMLVKMLVTVSCIYVTCAAPMVALTFARFLVTGFATNGRYRNIFYASHGVAFLIMMLNSSVNFFVYVMQSSRFKRELFSLFVCRKPTQPTEPSTNIMSNSDH